MCLKEMGKKRKCRSLFAGIPCAVVGIESFTIGDYHADIDNPEAYRVISVGMNQRMSMLFSLNTHPFFVRMESLLPAVIFVTRMMKETERKIVPLKGRYGLAPTVSSRIQVAVFAFGI